LVGIPRWQSRAGRDARARSGARAARGTGHRYARELPGADRLCLARLREIPFADAALCVSALARYAAIARGPAIALGARRRVARLSHAAGGYTFGGAAARSALGAAFVGARLRQRTNRPIRPPTG